MGRFTHESSRPYLSVRSLSEGIKVIVAEALPERKEDFLAVWTLQYNPVHGLVRQREKEPVQQLESIAKSASCWIQTN